MREPDDFPNDQLQPRRRLGDDRVNDPGVNFLGKVRAGQDDRRQHHHHPRRKQTEFGGLAYRILLVEHFLKLRDDDHANDRQRYDPQHAPPHRFAKANAADCPDAADAESPQVAKPQSKQSPHDDHRRGDPHRLRQRIAKVRQRHEFEGVPDHFQKSPPIKKPPPTDNCKLVLFRSHRRLTRSRVLLHDPQEQVFQRRLGDASRWRR